jgi:hypothetical protein
MPERLLGRIIESCSNAGDLVLDPFAGSGTTLAVAKKLGRRYLGFELSPVYSAQIERRLETTVQGQVLEGNSAHVGGKRTPGKSSGSPNPKAPIEKPEDIRRGIVAAFLATRDGFPVDRVIADPEINDHYIRMCFRLGLPGDPTRWNQALMNLRKASKLIKDMPRSRRTTFSEEEKDKYGFACEIAVQSLSEKYNISLDKILCDPSIAKEFDHNVLSIVHDPVSLELTPLKIRWAALGMRKKQTKIKKYAETLERVSKLPSEGIPVTIANCKEMPSDPGIYLLRTPQESLYVGETRNLCQRIDFQVCESSFAFWDNPKEEIEILYEALPEGKSQKFREANQSILIGRLNPIGNYKNLAISMPGRV